MTRRHLEAKAARYRALRKLPEHPYTDGKANVYHIGVNYNQYYGYSIFEIVTMNGAEHTHASGMSLKEAKRWFEGAIHILDWVAYEAYRSI